MTGTTRIYAATLVTAVLVGSYACERHDPAGCGRGDQERDGQCVPCSAAQSPVQREGVWGCELAEVPRECPDGTIALPGGCSEPWPCPDRWTQNGFGCAPPPLPSNCPEGSFPLPSGNCTTPWQCPPGWQPLTDRAGCTPILRDCDNGELPVAGGCQDLGMGQAACGDAPFGDETNLPDDAVYVDQAADAELADGSRARPWTTINEALAQAPSGTIVVAEGTYDEDLDLRGGTLRGRCAARVRVTGTIVIPEGRSSRVSSLTVERGGLIVEGELSLEQVRLRSTEGDALVIRVDASVLAESLWVDDPEGLAVRGDLARSRDHAVFQCRRCLFEGAAESTISADIAPLAITFDQVTLRDTRADALRWLGQPTNSAWGVSRSATADEPRSATSTSWVYLAPVCSSIAEPWS